MNLNNNNESQQPLFLPLTPVIIPETQEHNSHESQEQKNIYCQALDESLSNNQVHNIALLGPYGSGKSSVIKSYIASRNLEEHTITVTLGNYENNQDFSTGANSTQTAYERNANSIERQIILQLSSQIPSHKIKCSSYAFHTDRTAREKVISLIAIASFFIGVLALTSAQIYNLFSLAITYPYIDIIMFLMILFPVIYGGWLFLNSERFELSKINVNLGAASTELNKSSNHDETIFDKDIKQIVYMLIKSQAKIVIFEDLERFNDLKIFNKLKEINILANNAVKSNNSNANDKISFVYLLHDGLFTKENRTKYFDFSIPIIPILTTNSASHYIIREFTRIQKELHIDFLNEQRKLNFLQEISIFVNDLRLAKNILNEFIIYYKQAEIEKNEHNLYKLLIRIFFKNLDPLEYESFRKGTGKTFNLIQDLQNNPIPEKFIYEHREELCEQYKKEYNEEVELRTKDLNTNIKNFFIFLIKHHYINFFNSSLHDSNKNLLDTSYISRNDQNFINNYSSQIFKFDYPLDNPQVVYLQIKQRELYSPTNLLNLDLIKFILSDVMYNEFDNVFMKLFEADYIINLLMLLKRLRAEGEGLHYKYFQKILNIDKSDIFEDYELSGNILKAQERNRIINEFYSATDTFRELTTDITLYLLQNSKLKYQHIDSCIENFTNSVESALLQSDRDQIDVERIFAELQKLQIQLNPQAFPADHYLYTRILQHNASFTLTSTLANNEDEVTDDAQHK